MVKRSALASIGNIQGHALPSTGADLMMTGMLTACAFLYSSDKQNMICALIQPETTPDQNKGLKLGVDIMNGGKFPTNDVPRVFSHRDYNWVHHANILGVRRLDGWSIYAQVVDQNNGILAAVQLV